MDSYFITGASGYIGSMLAEKLLSQGERVDVLVRDAGRLSDKIRFGAGYIEADIRDGAAMSAIYGNYDYIIHCAAPTKSSYMNSHPVETAEIIVQGTGEVLKLAKRLNVKSMVYLSSMEVYGRIDCRNGERVTEEQLGYLDVTNVRSCYPIAKLMAENLCYAYFKEYGVSVKTARLAQTFGRGILPEESRVFAQFARAARDRQDIVLHTRGNSMGNYCSIDDAMNGILKILKDGVNGEAYNVVNEENTMTIRQMAELVAREIAHGKIQVRYDIPEENDYGYAADTGLCLSGEKLAELGYRPEEGLVDMYLGAMGSL